ncbi:MAG: S-methyl-5-thioribose kinase [Lachnospirales bacterium]
MSNYETYFLMKENEVAEYIKSKLDYFDKDAKLSVKEIGDGNLNYVFKVWDENNKSIIVKQAGGEARISADIKLSTDRTRIESEILILQDQHAKGLVPKLFLYDNVMATCIMEDLSDHKIMRKALMDHEIFPEFAEHISTFMVETTLKTTDICLDHKVKKAYVKSFINPELCDISEDLVFTEPYNNMRNRNNVYEPIKDFVEKELYSDEKLHLEVAKCKFDFMNNAQALIHGDLHTGSIFIKENSTKVFDPEFAFFGPIGYDVGNVVANLIFAWNNGRAEIEDEAKEKEFTKWVESAIADTIDLFIEKFNIVFDENVTDPMAKTKGFKEWYIDSILRDTASVAGLELIRRMVGLANVIDITSIKDENKRVVASKTCILVAKEFIFNRNSYKTGQSFVNAIHDVYDKF